MSRHRVSLVIVFVVAIVCTTLLSAPALAQDQTLILRFGPTLLESTSGSDTDLGRYDLSSNGGFEVNFEWMFHPLWGLEASQQISGDIDFESDDDTVSGAGVSFIWFTVGINIHPVRTERIDWGIGVMGGKAYYSDFEFDDDRFDIETTDDTVWGAQTFIDISVNRRWAVDLGVRYVETSINLSRGREIEYTPLVFRAMGVVRW